MSRRTHPVSRSLAGLPGATSLLALAWLSAGDIATASAASFGAGAYVTIWASGSNENPGDFFAADPAAWVTSDGGLLVPEGPVYSSGASTSAAASLTRTLATGTGSGSAAANFENGLLGVFGTLGVFSTSTMAVITSSTAGFSETITPLESGNQHFDINVTGTVSGPGTALGGAWFAIDNRVWLGTRGEPLADVPDCFGTGGCMYAFDIGVTAGVPYRVSMALQAAVSNATLDLSRTATLRVTGVPFTTDSGVYGSAVPAPGAFLLLGTGLAALLGWRGRKRTSTVLPARDAPPGCWE